MRVGEGGGAGRGSASFEHRPQECLAGESGKVELNAVENLMSTKNISLGFLLGTALVLAACTPEVEVDSEPLAPSAPVANLSTLQVPPMGPGALAPNLAPSPNGPILSWLEPDDPTAPNQHCLRLAVLSGDAWQPPQDIAQGEGFFANWTDLPAVAVGGDGTWIAHWLEKLGDATYAYGIQTASSEDGTTWNHSGLLHDDTSPTEHGFVTYLPTAEGTRAFWLDGRAMATTPPGPMQLRTALLRNGQPQGPIMLDDRVCECCSTDAALTADGPVVVYRDRSTEEIRDIAVVRLTSDGPTEPATLHDDGWNIHACPVNGPAIAANGRQVAVAWFTAADDTARVHLAFSEDAGTTFGQALPIDLEAPLGRVDIELDDHGNAWVLWLARQDQQGEIRLLRVSPSGEAGEPVLIAQTVASRAAGVPRMLRHDDSLLLTWVEASEPSQLRTALYGPL